MYRKLLKPLIDRIIAIIFLVILFPIMLIAAVGLVLMHGSNPIFLQARPGKGGKIFNIIKFKTMRDQIDSTETPLADHQRITTLGKILRRTSIDEFPQLINVLRGDMSIVGPRPLLVEYLSLYNDFQRRRQDVRPGITGWAQVNGRNSLSWKEKFELDIYYVDNQSFKLDMQIIIKTIGKVLSRSDVNSSENDTMERFTGNN